MSRSPKSCSRSSLRLPKLILLTEPPLLAIAKVAAAVESRRWGELARVIRLALVDIDAAALGLGHPRFMILYCSALLESTAVEEF